MGEVIDASINVYLRNLGKLLLIAAAVVVPLTVVIFALDLIALQEADPFDPNAALYQVGDSVRVLSESTFVTVSVIQIIVGVLAYMLVIGATFRAVSEAYLDRPLDVRGSIGFAAGKAHSLLWLSILLVVGLAIAFLAFVIPGIWLIVAWSVAVPALMVENLRGTKAIRRSFNLTRSHWFRTLGALIVGFIFIALIQFLIGLAAAGLDPVADDSVYAYAALLNVINAIAFIVTAPLQAAIVTVIYYDLRVRNEGFDVQLLAEQLDAPPAAPAPPAPTAPEPAVPGSVPPPGAGEPPLR